jgi:hypothetical protein
MPVIKATTLDLSKITFSDVKTDNHGRKMVFVNYDGGKIIVQTPKMYVPNGIKRWRKKDATDNKDDSFEMELSFSGEDKNPDISEFHNKMEQFDELVKKQIIAHSKEWLGKPKVSMELVENAFYSPTVRVPMDKEGNILEYPSRVRAKLDRERTIGDDFTGRFLSYKKPATPVLMFDESKTLLEMNEDNFESIVPKGSQVVSVLELVYLTITTKVSAKWKLVQARVSRNQQTITGYAMIDDEEAHVQEDLDSEPPKEASPVEEVSKEEVSKEVEEDEVEEDEVEEDEVEEDEVEEDEVEEDDVQEDELEDEEEPEPVVVAKPKPRGRKAVAA